MCPICLFKHIYFAKCCSANSILISPFFKRHGGVIPDRNGAMLSIFVPTMSPLTHYWRHFRKCGLQWALPLLDVLWHICCSRIYAPFVRPQKCTQVAVVSKLFGSAPGEVPGNSSLSLWWYVLLGLETFWRSTYYTLPRIVLGNLFCIYFIFVLLYNPPLFCSSQAWIH